MQHVNTKAKELLLTLNLEELSPVQVRLVKHIHHLLGAVVSAEDEAEYFEQSAELMKKCAELIRHASFPETHKQMDYAEQAVEFAVDTLHEGLDELKLGNIDN